MGKLALMLKFRVSTISGAYKDQRWTEGLSRDLSLPLKWAIHSQRLIQIPPIKEKQKSWNEGYCIYVVEIYCLISKHVSLLKKISKHISFFILEKH